MANDIKKFSQAIRALIARPEYQDQFLDRDSTGSVRAELGLTDEMATELQVILTSIPGPGASPAANQSSDDKLAAKAEESVSSAEEFLNRSFMQLRMGARVLMAMSVSMFLIGVGFLVIAGIRTFTHPDSATVTGVIAGVGITQIVLLFYRNPLQDIGRSISNAQQAKMIVMSYMLGVSLIAKSLGGKETEAEQAALANLTQTALNQLDVSCQLK